MQTQMDMNDPNSRETRIYRQGKGNLTNTLNEPSGIYINNDVYYISDDSASIEIQPSNGNDKINVTFNGNANELVGQDIRIVAFTVPNTPAVEIESVTSGDFDIIDGVYGSVQITVDPGPSGSAPAPPASFNAGGIYSNEETPIYPVFPNPCDSEVAGWYEPYVRACVVFVFTMVGVAIKDQYTMHIQLPGLGFRERVLYYRVYWKKSLIAAASAGALAYFSPRITNYIPNPDLRKRRQLPAGSDEEDFEWVNPP